MIELNATPHFYMYATTYRNPEGCVCLYSTSPRSANKPPIPILILVAWDELASPQSRTHITMATATHPAAGALDTTPSHHTHPHFTLRNMSCEYEGAGSVERGAPGPGPRHSTRKNYLRIHPRTPSTPHVPPRTPLFERSRRPIQLAMATNGGDGRGEGGGRDRAQVLISGVEPFSWL